MWYHAFNTHTIVGNIFETEDKKIDPRDQYDTNNRIVVFYEETSNPSEVYFLSMSFAFRDLSSILLLLVGQKNVLSVFRVIESIELNRSSLTGCF